MRGINVAHHAQVVHKGGEAGTGFIVTNSSVLLPRAGSASSCWWRAASGAGFGQRD